MRTKEEWFESERSKAQKYRLGRNLTGLGYVGFLGVQIGAEQMANIDITPDGSSASYVVIALTSLAGVASYRFHEKNRSSESSAYKAAAYEVNELRDTPYEPGVWATNALASANLIAEEVVEAPYGSIIKSKRIS